MRQILIAMALMVGGCERQPQPAAEAPPAGGAEIIATNDAQSKIPAVVPLPTDQAEIDRMILAGYTPHADHLHSPGVNECPLSKGNDAVM